jgi:uncharacterized protein
MELAFILFCLLLLLVAFLYSSVGHGGASGYLAVMALFGFLPEFMRPTALTLNVLVAGLAFYQFRRRGHFSWGLFWPFALASVPASFLGGMLTVDVTLYNRILGFLLLFAVWRMLWRQSPEPDLRPDVPMGSALLAGGLIGFFSGLIGIGGGIVLSPVILLMHWGNMRQTAAVSALFIFVNSLAGLAGLFHAGLSWDVRMPWMVVMALAGGLAGSFLGAGPVPLRWLRGALALVLAIAAIKLIFV